jgi:hypothetical protein
VISEFNSGRIRSGAASRSAAVATVVVLLFCVAACSGSSSAAVRGTSTASPVLLYDRSERQSAAFTSPDNNVSCAFRRPQGSTTEGLVRCEIIVKTWQPPAKPDTCTVDWGFGITLDTRAGMLCAGDTIRGDAGSVRLPYGTSIRFDPLTCISTQNGIDCRNDQTGAGFLLGRKTYQLRNP